MNISITKPFFDEKELECLKEVLSSGWVTQGPMTERFENRFCTEQNAKYGVAVSSCTAALHIAMLALGIGPGDEVIVPAFTWITSASCAEYVGATVKFVDVDKKSMNIDVSKIEEAITDKTKAIVAVHLFGNPADMDRIMEIAKARNIYVVEDCACAIGTEYKGRKVGTIGDIGCFSFHPRKAITTGEGGICSTNNENLYYRMLQFRNHGASVQKKGQDYGKPYYMGIYDELGYNLRLSDIQAAVGVAQFDKLQMLLEDRVNSAKYYIKNLEKNNALLLPSCDSNNYHTYQSFVVILKEGNKELRNKIMCKMQEEGIQSRPGTIAITRTEYNVKKYGLSLDAYPVANYCEDNSVTLPICPFMKREDQDYVIEVLSRELQ